MRSAAVVLLTALLAILLSGCNGCSSCTRKTDAERAAEERAKADDQWRGSLVLLPWRALKGAVRSKDAPNRPEIYVRFDAALAELSKPVGPDPEADSRARAALSAETLAYLVLHRAELTAHDEDEFPRLANVWTHTAPPLPAPWYDDPAEHLFVALGVLLLDAADQSDRVPARDIVFYELSRAPAREGWPTPLRLVGRYARGASYLTHAFYYAADEELTAYLEDVERTPPEDLELLAGALAPAGRLPTADGGQVDPLVASRELLRALGYGTRAYDRMKLGRDDAATDDTEKALEALDRIGVENELTLWGWAVVHQRRGRYDAAAGSLEKLADSGYLEPQARADIRAAAADVRRGGADQAWFRQERTSLAVVRAVVARLGGPEAITAAFLGRERAAQLFAPFVALSTAREHLRETATREGERFKALREGAADRGKKTFEGLKDKLTDAAAP